MITKQQQEAVAKAARIPENMWLSRDQEISKGTPESKDSTALTKLAENKV